MIRVLRRLGIAIGSFVMAWLVVGLIGGALLSLVGLAPPPTPTPTPTTIGLVQTVVTFVFGGLIYRDIIRRETR